MAQDSRDSLYPKLDIDLQTAFERHSGNTSAAYPDISSVVIKQLGEQEKPGEQKALQQLAEAIESFNVSIKTCSDPSILHTLLTARSAPIRHWIELRSEQAKAVLTRNSEEAIAALQQNPDPAPLGHYKNAERLLVEGGSREAKKYVVTNVLLSTDRTIFDALGPEALEHAQRALWELDGPKQAYKEIKNIPVTKNGLRLIREALDQDILFSANEDFNDDKEDNAVSYIGELGSTAQAFVYMYQFFAPQVFAEVRLTAPNMRSATRRVIEQRTMTQDGDVMIRVLGL